MVRWWFVRFLSEVWEKKKHLIDFSATVMVFLLERVCKCLQLDFNKWSVGYCPEHVGVIRGRLQISIYIIPWWRLGNLMDISASLGRNNLGIFRELYDKRTTATAEKVSEIPWWRGASWFGSKHRSHLLKKYGIKNSEYYDIKEHYSGSTVLIQSSHKCLDSYSS